MAGRGGQRADNQGKFEEESKEDWRLGNSISRLLDPNAAQTRLGNINKELTDLGASRRVAVNNKQSVRRPKGAGNLSIFAQHGHFFRQYPK